MPPGAKFLASPCGSFKKGIAFVLLCSLLAPSLVHAQPCPDRLASPWTKRLKWAAAGLVSATLSYAVAEKTATDSIRHFYPCPACASSAPREHFALIGDSLSTDFAYGSPFPTLFYLRTTRSGGWFTDRSTGRCFAEWCAEDSPVEADCHAQAGAAILSSPDASFGKRLGGIAHLPKQVNEILDGPLPDHLGVWIGHNDADYVYTCSKHPELNPADYCAKLPAKLRATLHEQIDRVAREAKRRGKAMDITLYGLMDFRRAIGVRKEILKAKKADPHLYPYLSEAIDGFLTLMPEHETIPDHGKLAPALSVEINTEWKALVAQFNEEYAGTGVRFRYSSVLADFPYQRSDFSERDGLHFSASGRMRLGKAVYLDFSKVD